MSKEVIEVIKESLKELVKEAVIEALKEQGKAVITDTVTKGVEVKQENKIKNEQPKADAKSEDMEIEKSEDEMSIADAIEALAYNDLKKKCKELEISAVGKREVLVKRILEHLEDSEDGEDQEESNNTLKDEKANTKANNTKKEVSEEEDNEDVEDEAEEFTESLSKEQIEEIVADMKKEELCAIIEEMGEEIPKYTKKKAVDMIVNGGQATIDALVLLGYVDSDEEDEEEIEESEEEVTLADELAELTTEELADLCSEFELSVKGKKQALIDRLVKAVEDGDISEDDLFEDVEEEEEEEEAGSDLDEETNSSDEDIEDEDADNEDVEDEEDWYSEEELEEFETDELKEIADEYEIEIPIKKIKKGKKTIKAIDRDALIQAILDYEDEDIDEDEEEEDYTEDEFEPSDERLESEAEIEEEIRAKYKSKKLKDADIKKFLVKYNEGNPDFKYSNLSKKEALEAYIEAKTGLVDDDGTIADPEVCYLRNNEYHCCGKQLSINNGTYYCEVCGNEFEE